MYFATDCEMEFQGNIKVIDFGTNRKRVRNFLLVINSDPENAHSVRTRGVGRSVTAISILVSRYTHTLKVTDSCIYYVYSIVSFQGSFPKKEVWEPTMRAPGVANGDQAPRAVRCGEGCLPIWWRDLGSGLCPLPRKKNRFWISNRRILVQTWCFLYSSPKAGFAFLGTPFDPFPLSK